MVLNRMSDEVGKEVAWTGQATSRVYAGVIVSIPTGPPVKWEEPTDSVCALRTPFAQSFSLPS